MTDYSMTWKKRNIVIAMIIIADVPFRDAF